MPDRPPLLDPQAFRFRPSDDGASDDRLARFPTDAVEPFGDEASAREATEEVARLLARHQLMLEAHGTHGVLVVVQGMDAAGKDEAIHHVMAAIDPEAGSARSFSSMEGDEAAQDFLRRASAALPARGELAIFNRSYYEQVTADRVSPELLDDQHLPPEIRSGVDDGRLWTDRLRQIRDFERYLHENGIHVVKLFLHVSKEVQRQRLLERIERPEKRWDFSRADVEKRADWDAFMDAYDAAFQATSTPHSPWYVIPADHKWYARAAAGAVVLAKLRALHDDFPEPDDEHRALLEWGREQLS